MASLYDQQSANVHRTWLLMAVFLVVVIAIGWAISWYYNSSVILYVAVAFALVMNIGSYWFSDKLVLSMTKARPASKEEFYDFYTVAENMAITAGLPMPKLYVIDDPAPNAFATGRDPRHAVVAATEGILRLCNDRELRGVLAHELAHVKDRDILLMTFAATVAGAISYLGQMFLFNAMFGGGSGRGGGGTNSALLGLIAAITAPIAALLIQLAISRARELRADEVGARTIGDPEALARALEKLEGANDRAPRPIGTPATASLCIVNPLRGGGLLSLFSTHPPLAERVRRLRAMPPDFRYRLPAGGRPGGAYGASATRPTH
jgi:heat shock protein HtpX